MDSGYKFWLSGLIDGEGCFLISESMRRGETGKKSYALVKPVFRLALRADDEPVLLEASLQTGLGTVRRYEGHGGRNPISRWNIASKDDLVGLVELLEEAPLRSKKKRDFEIWAEAVQIATTISPGGGNNSIWSRLEELKIALQAVRQFEAASACA